MSIGEKVAIGLIISLFLFAVFMVIATKGYSIICIDGHEYIKGNRSLTNKLDDNGKPIKCTVEK